MTTIYGPREVVQGEFYSYIATLTLPTTSPYRESLQNLGAGESGNRGLVACVYLQPPSSSYMETVRPTAASRDSQRCTEDVHLNEKNDASGVTQFLVSLPDLSFTELGEASLQTFWYEAVTGDVLASSQLFLKISAGAGREAFLSAIQKALAQFFQVSETDVEVQIVRISGSGDITGISGRGAQGCVRK
ncbi:hypothetical protein VOLCADRAFT_89595 [Volvox carteri f. nagariensis]|uniref:Uncharacterized protein n=1 Tax=Volvox carteri f. nagariensis TaxID=3068 RepID=D8TS92_VOLCA|nr:uncharacterized protein VOLCADRAFT_89595 [Volvox carteri f. nagariensis]EFJ49652.1 hypothetical protein VOLCADRAFT_89595 [Volvox carteri f. nagariensis]|eukprot:XP_002949159.1 hypothetical protein VOLCADRAFT_89595 [Volvox carteri f. nagariensis]